MRRAIAHIDADCFFVSVELRERPELRGKPVAVCSRTDRRGIVVSASYEARKFGIRAGTPVFKMPALCADIILLPCRFEQYQLASYRLMQILRDFSPDVEEASVDEAYVDLTGLRLLYRTDYAGIGQMIQKKVEQELGITVSIGIAETKTLAKLASDYRKPIGLTAVPARERENFLKKIPAKDIAGVGKNTEALLQKFGILTAYELASANPELIQKLLGKRGEDLAAELSGTSRFSFHRSQALPQSLSRSRTFPDFSSDQSYISAYSLKLLLGLASRLRAYGLQTDLVAYYLVDKQFRTFGEKRKLLRPVDEDRIFMSLFQEIFRKNWKSGTMYRKCGFIFGNLTPKGPSQMSLFQKNSRPEIDPVFDKIRQKFGSKAITRGSLLIST